MLSTNIFVSLAISLLPNAVVGLPLLAIPAGLYAGHVAVNTAFGAASGAIARDRLPLNNTRRDDMVKAGAVQGLVDGAALPLKIFSLNTLTPATKAAAESAAAKILDHPDVGKVAGAAAASGSTEILHQGSMNLPFVGTASGAAKGAISAKILGTSEKDAAETGAIGGLLGGSGTDSGSLFAIAQSADALKPRENKKLQSSE